MEQGRLPLRDIHLPEAISWWPPALGWWLLATLIPLLIGFGYWLYRRLTRQTAIKAAKKILLQIKQDPQLENNKKLNDLSALIRRVAISTADRHECAGLAGDPWLAYLDRSLKSTPFSEGVGRLLANGPYQQYMPTDLEISELTRLCEDWLNAQSKKRK